MNKLEKFNFVLKEMADIYAEKNADYGDSFASVRSQFPVRGISLVTLVRLSDKLNRLINLYDKEAQVDESIRDTLVDLANYAVMEVVELDNESESDK